MPVQQISADPPNQDQENTAAMQRKFPKPVAHSLPNRQNPIRPFAAPGVDFSHADEVAVHGSAQLEGSTDFSVREKILIAI